MEKKNKSRAVKVELFTPDGRKEYYFGCLKAIYTKLTTEQIGVALSTLYQAGITAAHPYANSRCMIRYVDITRVAQRERASRGSSEAG